MSFIYENDQLIKQLLEAAEKSMRKQGQNAYSTTMAKAVPDYELAQKLLFNLQRDLGDPSAPVAAMPIGTEGDASVDLTAHVPDFRTLGDFLRWASDKKLTWKGKRFAWSGLQTDPSQTPPEDALQFDALPANRAERGTDRQPATAPIFADKTGLIEYLTALRDGPEAKSNKMFAFMLATLIGEVNGHLRAVGETPIGTKPQVKAKDAIDPNIIVDVVPAVLDIDNVNDGLDAFPFLGANINGSTTLTVADLKDEASFKSWLRVQKVKVTTPAKDKQPAKSVVVSPLDTAGDPCLAVHILFKRASQLRNGASAADDKVPNYSKAVAQYLQSVLTFGKTLTGKDGQACAVTQPGTLAGQADQKGQGAGTGQGTGQGAGIGSGGAMTPAQLQQMVSSLPLKDGMIDFPSIRAFFSLFGGYLGGSTNERAASLISTMAKAEKYMLIVSGMTKENDQQFDLNRDSVSIATMLKPPINTSYVGFLHNLEYIVDLTANVINGFYQMYATGDRGEHALTSEQRSLIGAQSGGTNSYNIRNKVLLQRLASRVNEVVNIK